MSMLIADSGSTKTDWVLIQDGTEISFRTEGLNPWQMSAEEFTAVMKNEVVSKTGAGFSGNVFFYGAGCGTKEKSESWKNIIASCLPKAKVEVNTDLLGAARALCGNSPGIVAILGTGSNSCFYDGKTIAKTRPSPGFVYGDEGGGSHIGKNFLSAYLAGELKKELAEKFEKETGMDQKKILDGTYRQPHPNRFLASFAAFVISHKEDEQCRRILEESFSAFTSKHILHYDFQHHKVNVTGSVGIHCKEMLVEMWGKSGIQTGKFLEHPIDGMKEYHLGNSAI